MEAIIKDVYESNFGTAYETYKEAVEKDNSVRLQDVKDYLSKRDDIQVKSKPKAYNILFHLVLILNMKQIVWTSKLKELHLILVMDLSLSIILLKLPR